MYQLLSAPDRRSRRGRRDGLILVFLGIGGTRASEVCRLNAQDARIQGCQVLLHVTGKQWQQRLVPIPGEWITLSQNYLRSWLEARGETSLFWCSQTGNERKRLTVPAIDYLVRQKAKAASIDHLSAHALRHTAASLAIEAGEPLHRLRDRLGHSSVLVTSWYLHAR